MGRSVARPSNAVTTAYLRFIAEDEWAWDDFVEDLRNVLTERFPSLYEEDRWVGREEKSILRNELARIIIAEYCGTVSVSLVALEGEYGDESPLGTNWCNLVAGKLHEHLRKRYPGSKLEPMGTASNGETFYRLPGGKGTVVERGEVLDF